MAYSIFRSSGNLVDASTERAATLDCLAGIAQAESESAAEVSVTADGGGSRARWAVRFRSRLPLTGPLIAAVLQRRIARALTGLPGALPHDPQKDRRHP